MRVRNLYVMGPHFPQRLRWISLTIFLAVLGPIIGMTMAHSQEFDGPPLAQGVFLLATPEMRDPNFIHAVIVIVQYGKDGCAGLMINKPTSLRAADALSDLSGANKLSEPIFFGGPVQQDRLFILLYGKKTIEDAGKILDDLYLTVSKKGLSDALKEKDPGETMRLYAGYAGWGAGQLEREIRLGAWRILRPDTRMIFSEDPSTVWSTLLRRGPEHVI